MGKVELKETDGRRIFHIDVGSMPAERIKQYLEEIKRQLRDRPPSADDQLEMKDDYWI